jgi:hypothetical protein
MFNTIETPMRSWPEEKSGMLRAVLPVAAVLTFVLSSHSGQAATITTLKSLRLDVPTSDAMFPAGPGSDAINNNRLACHSADHVLNQPSLSRRPGKRSSAR